MADDFAAWYGTQNYQQRVAWLQSIGAGPQDYDNLLVDEIKRQYGYLASYLSHPEIGPLLRRAAAEGWTQERLQADLYQTNYWKTTAAATRDWLLLAQTDPAEATKRIESMADQLRLMVDQAGVGNQFTENELKYMSGTFLHQGMNESQVRSAILAHAQYQPGGAPTGTMGMTMNQVKTRASDFGLPMSDGTAFWWSKQVATGNATPDAFDVWLRDQAKSRYSWLAPDLDRGATVRQLFDPMLQQTSQLLEISAADIDLTDPKFSSMIDHVDSSGQRRSMTTAEAATYARSLPDWQTTDNATKAASLASESILRTFGKVAQ